LILQIIVAPVQGSYSCRSLLTPFLIYIRSPQKYAQKGSITDWASNLRQRIPLLVKDKESPIKLEKYKNLPFFTKLISFFRPPALGQVKDQFSSVGIPSPREPKKKFYSRNHMSTTSSDQTQKTNESSSPPKRELKTKPPTVMKLNAIPQQIQGFLQYPLRASPEILFKPKPRAPSIGYSRPSVDIVDKEGESLLNKSLDKGLKILLSKIYVK